MAAAPSTSSVRPKEFHFPVTVEWLRERRVAAHVEGKSAIEITSPPVFQGSDPTTWSPEDFFVAAAASCLAVTFTGLAARAGLAYTSLSVDGDGVAARAPALRRHHRPRRAAPKRLQAARHRRPCLSRLHGRRPLRRPAAQRAPRTAARERVR